jgi:hypothetical protein
MRIHDVKTVAGERGAADAKRDIRRFALKFYTEDGKLGHRRKQYSGLFAEAWCGASIEAECFKGRLTPRIWSNRF